MSDFEPASIIQQVEPLKKLLDTRNRLRDLVSKVDRSAELERILEQVLKNTADLQRLSSELGVKSDGGRTRCAAPSRRTIAKSPNGESDTWPQVNDRSRQSAPADRISGPASWMRPLARPKQTEPDRARELFRR